jgi:hypothetical protein
MSCENMTCLLVRRRAPRIVLASSTSKCVGRAQSGSRTRISPAVIDVRRGRRKVAPVVSVTGTGFSDPIGPPVRLLTVSIIERFVGAWRPSWLLQSSRATAAAPTPQLVVRSHERLLPPRTFTQRTRPWRCGRASPLTPSLVQSSSPGRAHSRLRPAAFPTGRTSTPFSRLDTRCGLGCRELPPTRPPRRYRRHRRRRDSRQAADLGRSAAISLQRRDESLHGEDGLA